MKIKLRRILSFMLVIVLMLASGINALAWGGAGGVGQPTSGHGSGGNYPKSHGYGFRVYLHDTATDGILWDGDITYKAMSGVNRTLDADASKSALYLGVEPNYKVYDAAYGDAPWVDINTISDAEFNTMPSMSGYLSPTSRKSTNFDSYAAVFNQINAKADTPEGMQEIINWFTSKGVETGAYDAATTLVVVEPVAKWTFGGGYFVFTYQNARAYDNSRTGCFSFFNFTPSMSKNCTIEGDRYIPSDDKNKRLTDIINAYLGGFYQEWIFDTDDCTTQAYDSTSGYAFYGAAKVNGNKGIAGNIAVVYDGATGTSNPENFKVYNVLGSSDRQVYAGEGWKNAGNNAEALGLASEADLNDYSIALEGIYKYDVSADKAYKAVNDALKADKLGISWATKSASGSTYNVGSAHSIAGVSYNGGSVYTNASPVASSAGNKLAYQFSEAFSSGAASTEKTPVEEALNLLERAKGYSTAGADASGVKAGSKMGVSVEVLCKGEDILSHMVAVNVDISTGTVTSEYKSSEYTTAGFGHFELPENACQIIAVPNSDAKAYSDSIVNQLKSAVSTKNANSAKSAFKNFFNGSSKEVDSAAQGGDTVTCGNKPVSVTAEDGTVSTVNVGYTVYVLVLNNMSKIDGDLTLQDYELNYVYPDAVSKSTGIQHYCKLGKNLWTIDKDIFTEVTGSLCNNVVGNLYNTKNYEVTIYDKSEGTTVAKDNALDGTKLLLYNKSNGEFAKRGTVKDGFTVDTSNGTDYTVTYAFNLVRSLFGDVRTVSTISTQNIGEDYAKKVLGLDYGNKPLSAVKKASAFRHSFADVGTIEDTLKFTAVYKKTGSMTKYTTSGATHTCTKPAVLDAEGNVVEEEQHGSADYHNLVAVENALKAFKIGGGLSPKFELDITSLAYKYSTEGIEAGENSTKGVVATRLATDGTSKGYAFSVVKESSKRLGYYGEVPMRAYEYSGDTLNSVSDVTERTVKTMSEEKRVSKSSSLYIYRVKEVSNNKPMLGTTISDTMMASSWRGSSSNNKVTIPAGSDMTVKSDSNYTINLYGYSLDLINKSKDGDGLKLNEDTVIPYSAIIADSSDVYSDWGNMASDKLFEEYKAWAAEMLNVRNYQVDLNLTIKKAGSGSTKEYNNFTAAIGGFSSHSDSEGYVYPLVIRHGEVDRTEQGYKALVAQIASDYDTTEAEAENIFITSGLYTAVLKAIESDNAEINASQSGPKNLGSSARWYDEEVKTMVIRRFSTTPVTIRDIIAQDKVDFGTAQDAGAFDGKGYGLNTATGSATWTATIFFGKEIGGLENLVIYDPAKKNESNAVNSGDIIINKAYISGADFVIPNSTTSDFGL